MAVFNLNRYGLWGPDKYHSCHAWLGSLKGEGGLFIKVFRKSLLRGLVLPGQALRDGFSQG